VIARSWSDSFLGWLLIVCLLASLSAEQKMFEHMSLQSLYKRPPPIWIHPAFLGTAFCIPIGPCAHRGAPILTLARYR
jgi:hypothetical protein